MRVSQISNYALRLNYKQMTSDVAHKSGDRATVRSAAILAAFGIALSSFSLKQMLNKPAVVIKRY